MFQSLHTTKYIIKLCVIRSVLILDQYWYRLLFNVDIFIVLDVKIWYREGFWYPSNGYCVKLVHTEALIQIVSLQQEGDFLVRTHHVEYCDGGILDPDDVLSDLVEDKDKVGAPL